MFCWSKPSAASIATFIRSQQNRDAGATGWNAGGTRPPPFGTQGKRSAAATTALGGRGFGLGKDAAVVVFVAGDYVVGAEFGFGVEASLVAHFAAPVGARENL